MTKQEQIEKIQEIINDCYVVDSYIAAERGTIMKSKDYYESISARKYANGALELVKTGKTNNALIMRDWYRGEKRRARLSRPKKTRRIYDYEN